MASVIEEIDEQRIEELRGTIDQLVESGKYEQAQEAIHQLLREHPDDWQGLTRLSQCLLMEESFEEAEEIAEQLLEQDPHSEEALLLMSQIYKSQAQWDNAIRYLEQVIAINPEWDIPHYGLAEALYRKPDLAKSVVGYFRKSIKAEYWECHNRAESELLKAMELNPDQVEHHALYGLVLDRLLRVQEAEVHLRKAIVLGPMHPIGHAAYAEFLFLQGKFKEFRDHAKQALMLDPRHSMSQGLSAKLEQYETSPAKILKTLIATHQIRAKFSKQPAYHYLRAAMLMIEHGDTRPRKELQAYLRYEPDDENAQLLYGKALFESRRYNQAHRYFRSLQQQRPGNVYIEQWLRKCDKVSAVKRHVIFPVLLTSWKIVYYLFYPPLKLLGWPIYLYIRNKRTQKGEQQLERNN